MAEPLPIGATIGILGGGQLGRMLAMAAARLGLKTHIYDPAPGGPAEQVATLSTIASWDNTAALEAFARSVDVVTYEFENIPVAAFDLIEAYAPLHPNRRALETAQDRMIEKTFLQELGLAVAPFACVDDPQGLDIAIEQIGTPSILKTRRLGYDGKGQARLLSAQDAAAAWNTVGAAPSVLEGFVDFSCEISVIAARGADGQVSAYDPGQNIHEGGILRTTTVPASVPRPGLTDAVLMAGRILSALDYVGVMGVELFVTPAGLLVNEIAPRVHNSGHWTQTGCTIDQFEQHIRAIAGWPLGDGQRFADVVMENLIGADIDRIPALAQDGVALHLYGKSDARPGRKMGHANRVIRES